MDLNGIRWALVPVYALGAAVHGGDVVILDQIGPSPAFLAGSSSGSQFNPASPALGSVTIDNFTISGAAPVRLTGVEAVVAALINFSSYELVESWTVQIYSSPEAAVATEIGDVFSVSFAGPATLTSGYDGLFQSELASFDVDVVLSPGDYWIGVAMGNVSAVNGVVGIRHSLLGDGPAYLAVSSVSQIAPVAPAAYRITGSVVPGPSALAAILLLALMPAGARRSRGAAAPAARRPRSGPRRGRPHRTACS
jgi:hypothetical protein